MIENNKNITGEKLKERLRFAVHDIRNLLNNVLVSTTKLGEDSVDNLNSKLISRIESNTLRAMDVIDSIFKEQNKIQKRKVVLNNLLLEVCDDFQSTLPSEIVLEKIFPEDNISAEIVVNDFYRSIQNLLVNAKEAINHFGNIKVILSKLNENAIIKIIDNGTGIKPENIEFIFDEGFSTKQKFNESGLGLFNVKQIIENSAGEIKVSSEPGKTIFEILLPICGELKPQKSKERKTILIADDETVIRELLSDLFSSMGLDVKTASNGEEVLKKFDEQEEFDLLIIDKKMPVLNGADTVKILRDKGCVKPIVIATGSLEEDDNFDYSTNKIDGVIRKPFQFEELSNLVLKLI